MTQKKRPDLNKILRSIFLILGIVLILLKISARASAEGYSSVRDYVVDFFPSTYDFSSYDEIFEYDYITSMYYSYNGYPRYLAVISSAPEIGLFSGYSDSFSMTGLFQYAVRNNTDRFYYYVVYGNENNFSIYHCTATYSETISNYYVFSVSSSAIKTSNVSNQLAFLVNGGTFKSNYDVLFLNRALYPTRIENYTSYYNIEDIVFSDSVDSRFSAWTSLDQSGKKLLNVSWDSQAYPNTGNFVYESSTIALQVAVNGQSSTVLFSSIDYPELFISGNSSYIPYKFIQKLANIATVQPSDTFYLEKITLTQQAYPSAAGSSASQSYTASTVYSLNLGEDVVEIPNIQQVQTVSVNYTQIVSGADFAVSSGTSVTPPDWANILSIAICDYTSAGGSTTINDPSLYDYIFMKDNGAMALYSSSSSDFNINIFVNGLTASSTEVSVPFQQGLSLFYKDFLPELFNSYDVVLISMNSINGSSATVTDSYYYTASYYSKLSIRSLGNLQLGVEAAAYYSKALYDYCYIRFNGIAESLESMRISNNNLLSSINANILNLQDLVSSETDRIVNAISGISSGGGGMSVSDLSGALNTLFMPSFEWDQVNYHDYLDSMGVLALPFEFVFDTQSIIKNNYSASLVMPVNDFSVPLGKDFSDNNIEFTVFEDQEDFTFVPTSIFPAALWSVFQYLAAFGLVIGEAWFTYVHIFRKEEKSGDF